MNITLTKITTTDKQYLRFAEETWNEDGEMVGQKVGFVQVLPEKADDLLKKYLSGEKKRVFGTQNNLGNYEMILVSESTVAATGELTHSVEA
jgi:hypothetical protein